MSYLAQLFKSCRSIFLNDASISISISRFWSTEDWSCHQFHSFLLFKTPSWINSNIFCFP